LDDVVDDCDILLGGGPDNEFDVSGDTTGISIAAASVPSLLFSSFFAAVVVAIVVIISLNCELCGELRGELRGELCGELRGELCGESEKSFSLNTPFLSQPNSSGLLGRLFSDLDGDKLFEEDSINEPLLFQ
jgi:hypothetical protein